MPDQQDHHLKLGKGRSFFVKSQLGRLRQTDETWEVDYLPVPQQGGWLGLVIGHTDESVLALLTTEQPPSVNDLADLLGRAMRRPLFDVSRRPQALYIRQRPEWAELLPHLKQVGIKVEYQDELPKWDDAFGDYYTQVVAPGQTEGKSGRGRLRKERPMKRKGTSPAMPAVPTASGNVRLYTLEVLLLSGPITEKFAKKNPVISRTIKIRGDQTLQDLHHAIFDAFGRWEEHMYEFQFGEGPMDPKAPRYVLPNAYDIGMGERERPAGRVDQTTLDLLGLEPDRSFGYWFDFGDDWWHQINVNAIEETVPKGRYPKVTKKVGKSPPQYADE